MICPSGCLRNTSAGRSAVQARASGTKKAMSTANMGPVVLLLLHQRQVPVAVVFAMSTMWRRSHHDNNPRRASHRCLVGSNRTRRMTLSVAVAASRRRKRAIA